MQRDGVSLTPTTLVSKLRACTILEAVDKGWIVHVQISQEGGSLEKAWDIFYNLRVHDVVTWTTLIVAYIEHGEEALKCFAETWG